jgi:hypothetical protein
LTDRQIFEHQFRPRDDKGNPKPLPAPQLYREVKDIQKMKMEYFMTASAFGMNPKVIQDNWDEYERRGYN